MPDAFDHCADLLRVTDRDRHIATLFAPERHRGPLHALYAFNAEIARVRDQAREPMPGEIRLQWWRDELTGFGTGESSAAPVAVALRHTIVRYRLPPHVLADLIEARSFDLHDDPMRSLAELETYAARTSSAVMQLAAQILSDGNGTGVAPLTRPLGIAFAIAGLLETFPLHARRRQLYVPLDLLHDHGARTEDVFAGVATPAVRAALAAMRKVALGHLSRARGLIAAMPAAIAPAILPAALARSILDRMERRDYDPFKLEPLPQWRRQLLLWRAARNPRRIVE